MLKSMTIKEKLSEFRPYPLLFLATFFLLMISCRAEAVEAVELNGESAVLKSSLQSDCSSDKDSGRDNSRRCHEKKTHNKQVCCPGPKGETGPRGPQGISACPGVFTDFASYQLIFMPQDTSFPLTIGGGTAISFQRQVLIKGGSISSFSPFSVFQLMPGIYEISVGVSTVTGGDGRPSATNTQLELNVGSNIYSFPGAPIASNFVTYSKIVQVFIPTDVSVTTSAPLNLIAPATTGLEAYINFIRLH